MSTAATVPASAPEAEQCPAEEAPKVVEADVSAEPYAADAEVAEVSNDTLVLPTMAVAIVIGPWRISFQATDLCSLSTTHPRLTFFLAGRRRTCIGGRPIDGGRARGGARGRDGGGKVRRTRVLQEAYRRRRRRRRRGDGEREKGSPGCGGRGADESLFPFFSLSSLVLDLTTLARRSSIEFLYFLLPRRTGARPRRWPATTPVRSRVRRRIPPPSLHPRRRRSRPPPRPPSPPPRPPLSLSNERKDTPSFSHRTRRVSVGSLH